MTVAHDTQALVAIRDNARKFAEKHAAELARELIEWQDTALLCGGQGGGKLRELAEMVKPFAGEHEMQVAESMAKRAALDAIASRLQEQEGQPALSALADSWDDSAESDHSDHGKTLSACADELRATLAAGSQAVQVPGWRPIETAPRGANGVAWFLLAWGPEGEQSTGVGMRIGEKFFAAGLFYRLGQEKAYEFREVEIQPAHWMPLPDAPLQPLAGGEVLG